jgi:plastocyanin
MHVHTVSPLKFVLATTLVVGLSVAAAQAASASGSESASVVFTAHDYGFKGPDQIPSGITTVRVANQGKEPHHVQLVKLAPGKTAVDFAAAMKADPDHPPAWIAFVGGPNAVAPGGQAEAIMRLDAGEYLLLCLIPNQQGVPHVALGMQKPVTVMPGKSAVAAEPKSDLTITQADFSFSLSQPITAGHHTIQVTNKGGQPHEVVVVKLAPGATARDWAAAFEPGASGPPPGLPIGGIVGIEKGGRGYFTGDFESGRYGLLCFFPDPQTGVPHFAQGMTLDVSVK